MYVIFEVGLRRPQKMYCPKCGTENTENADFCENCGSSLSETQNQNSSADESGVDSKPSMVVVVLGYIFALSALLFGLLGGIIGIIIGIYLYTRKNPNAKFHGRNIVVIAALMIVLSYQLVRFLGL